MAPRNMNTLFLFFKCYTNLQSTRSIKWEFNSSSNLPIAFMAYDSTTCESFDRMYMKIIIFFFLKKYGLKTNLLSII